MHRTALAFYGVTKTFRSPQGHKVILAEQSFEIPIGASIGILARNGTGKSTLINIMAGLEPVDEGVISRHARIGRPLGYASGLNPRLTGVENVRMAARLHGQDPDAVEAWTDWLSDLGRDFRNPVKDYSQGMKARLAFAMTLAVPTDVYLIDEGMPVTSDQRFNARAMAVLEDRMRSATVIMVSHVPDLLERHCSTGAVLSQGHLEWHPTMKAARSSYEALLAR